MDFGELTSVLTKFDVTTFKGQLSSDPGPLTAYCDEYFSILGCEEFETVYDARFETVYDARFDTVGYVATLLHSEFGVYRDTLTIDEGSVLRRYALAAGDLTGSRPDSGASATWTGVMAGVSETHEPPADYEARERLDRVGDHLHGDVSVTYLFNSKQINMAVSNIKNIDKNKSYYVQQVGFDNVQVNQGGEFSQSHSRNEIRGAFFGPNHAEVAGTFRHSGIRGALGAKRITN